MSKAKLSAGVKLAANEEIAHEDAYRVCVVNKKTGNRRWFTAEELKEASKAKS